VHTAPTLTTSPLTSIAPSGPLPRHARRRAGPTGTDVAAAREALDASLGEAATLELDDAPAWDRLRVVTSAAIAELVAAGVLPEHVRIDPEDGPVVVARTVAAAWRWSDAH
jgi:hypothetical protein